MIRTILLLLWALGAAAQKRPNIVIIMADDMGYSDLSCYGGEIHTPNIDRLAQQGLRYRQFYNAARCCPTRASLMTGLYPHQAGMGWMAAADLGRDAYRGDLNRNCVTIAELLKTAGYATAMTGKWHLTLERKIDGGVTDSWPLQRGFERFFGIVPGGASYFTPRLYSGNTAYKAPENYYLTHAITDTATRYIKEHFTAGDRKPLFLYVAYTAPHWPLHALQGDIDRYRGYYSRGWDQLREQRLARQQQIGLFGKQVRLSPRDPRIPAWETLSADERQEMALRMAVYAAQIDAMDQGVGKIVEALRSRGQLDNTVIFFLSDNGACAEYVSRGDRKTPDGGADTFESYRIHWANLSSTPFRGYKHFTQEGGIATPLIIHWPRGIDPALKGLFTPEYGHVTDLMATCAELGKAAYPTQYAGRPIPAMAGKSLVPHFHGRSNQRGRVYWEHEANIALRDGKWKLVAKTAEDTAFSADSLELFNMEDDPAEARNLAQQLPQKRDSLFAAWKSWAQQLHILPMDTREYGARAREYRRHINGGFDLLFGGWNVKTQPGKNITFRVDSSGKLGGGHAALIEVNQAGSRPADAFMAWNFPARKGERFRVKLRSRAAAPANWILRLERNNGQHTHLVDARVSSDSSASPLSLVSAPAPEEDSYRLALYFGNTEAGAMIWIDDVELTPL